MPNNDYGSIADVFNRIHHYKNESVSKIYVYEKLKAPSYQVNCKRKDIKTRKLKTSAINHTWGIDLTAVNINGKQRLILGKMVAFNGALNIQTKMAASYF